VGESTKADFDVMKRNVDQAVEAAILRRNRMREMLGWKG